MNEYLRVEDTSRFENVIKENACIAVIPARGGSKSIKNKNIKLLNGKPLICYSINHALVSKKIDNVYVTSDSQEILDIARQHGAIPILRPQQLANDIIHPEPSILHVLLEFFEKYNYLPACTIMLQPTSPIREINDIDNSIKDIFSGEYNSSISGTKTHYFIWEKDSASNWIAPYGTERPRRQDFHQITETGSFFSFNTKEFLKTGNRIISPTNIIETSQNSSYEIDSPSDWEIMESLIKQRK